MTLSFKETANAHIRAVSGHPANNSTLMEQWQGLSAQVIDHIADDWHATTEKYRKGRRQHYFSAEFLMGRALQNNLLNLGLFDQAKDTAQSLGIDINDILEKEPDAALGNGGLGRLAACFLDSCATQNLPVVGYGILYRYGLFKQAIENGYQQEYPDPWMEEVYPMVVRREEQQRIVSYADLTVRALPYDMPITGYGTKNVGTLRLWKAESMEEFDYQAFNSQHFTEAIVERERTSDISRVLYPNDSTYEGKVLRVRQQYFFVSASLQEIVENHLAVHGTLKNFAKYNCIQLNDTHPVLAIPELMRLLMDENSLGWEQAWEIVSQTFAYTNHTVLTEALETWEISIFERLFPRIMEIIREIDRRFREEMKKAGYDQEKINYMAPLSGSVVRMAWIACYGAYSINGVAAIHTEIIKSDTLKHWHEIWPEKFNNKTNGVTPRRWLNQCNPRLAALLNQVVGSDDWVRNMDLLTQYKDAADDELLDRLIQIKLENKKDFAQWIEKRQGVKIDPLAIFDVQIKRLHEYKRQLLNIFYVLDLYFRIKENPTLKVPPRVFIFGAKAAPGYVRAKAIIKLINEVGRLIDEDPVVSKVIKVLFIENYNVTPAEKIIPATDVHEQISTAGKEASGTSNMKFMMNGAITLGTMDGANVEIHDAVGDDNAYIFGATVEQLPQLRRTYDPYKVMDSTKGLSRVMNALIDGTLNDDGSGMFHDIHWSLLNSNGREEADVYYVLGDFEAYRQTRDRQAADYANSRQWSAKAWQNIVASGRFSSDRTIGDYASGPWQITSEPI